jgi:CheY-like chemotaxis protein/two-component sensor histidine kinase
MSHELRTPLNAILGFAQVLQMHALPVAQKEIVRDIHDAGKHLFALINEVLDISRIETDGLPLSIEPIELQEVARASINLIAPLAAGRSIRIVSELEGCAHHAAADRQRLSQCLLNLLSNAVKYNRDAGTITVSCEEAEGNRLRIKVADTGVGIAADKLGRLFTPFDRLGAETTGVEGTGLGLALTKRLVEAMHGSINFENTEEAGSTFCIELPRAVSPLTRLAETGELHIPQTVPPYGDYTVLYIEDNLQNLKVIQLVLAQRPGVKMLSAMQGSIGLELASRHHLDLILLDLNLPDLPGTEVLHRLQANLTTRDVPVIVLSADATQGQITRLLQAGARHYLTKPLDVRQFLNLLDEILMSTEAKNEK